MSVLAHLHPHEEPRRQTRECLGLLLKVLNEHDPGVLEDLNRMGHLAADTARAVGLDEREVERVELAARLHDVGKIAVPDAILNKPEGLDAQEWEVMRTHPEIGARIVASAPSLAHIADLIRSHHERHDGTGYPDGLSGEEIPVSAAIIAVCAAFVAMMRHRPYSDAITVEEALAEMRRCAGTQFHPGVVAAFCRMFS
jgi:HD-GYP domain-containing protein (c-di-GMP phosphodiesterase class II)